METSSRIPSLANFCYTPFVKVPPSTSTPTPTSTTVFKHESVAGTHLNRTNPSSPLRKTSLCISQVNPVPQNVTQPQGQGQAQTQTQQTSVKSEEAQAAPINDAFTRKQARSYSKKSSISTTRLSSKTRSILSTRKSHNTKSSSTGGSGSGSNNSSSKTFTKLSQEVEKLERREAHAQRRKKELKEEIEKLATRIKQLEDQSKRETKEHKDLKLKHKNLQTAYDVTLQDFEEEKTISEALRTRSEDAEAELANTKHENRCLAEKLGEKTHESYVYRCAVAVAFKLFGTLREKTTMRELLQRIVARLNEKGEGENQPHSGAATNDNGNMDEGNEDTNEGSDELIQRKEEQLASPPPVTPDTGLKVKRKPTAAPAPAPAPTEPQCRPLPIRSSPQKCAARLPKRPWCVEEDDDSDDDKPMVQVRRAKRLRQLVPLGPLRLDDDDSKSF